MKERSDAALVDRCLRGDNVAFEMLVSKYHKPVFNLALRMAKVTEDAEDITQTVFVKAYEKLDSYNPAHRFFSWIYRIAVNESINFCKRARPKDDYESSVTGATRQTPEEDFRVGELGEQVVGAIGRLKLDYRLVIVLKHFHDFSYREMSEVLQIPKKTVKSRLFTARQQLKTILEREGIRG